MEIYTYIYIYISIALSPLSTIVPINNAVMKEWKRYSNMPAAKHLFSSTTLCAYRQPPNLRQMLVKTRISTTPTITGKKKCMKSRCQICNIIDTRPCLKIPGTNITVRPGNYYCNSSNVIYLIKCKKCDTGNYIGETSTFFRLRMNNQKKSIRDNNKGLPVARHFNNQTTQSLTLSALYWKETSLTTMTDWHKNKLLFANLKQTHSALT